MTYVLGLIVLLAFSASIFANYVLFVQLQNKTTALLAVVRPEVHVVVERSEDEPSTTNPVEEITATEEMFYGTIDE